MNTSLDYRNRFLCVLADDGIQQKCWFPVIEAEHSEVRTLLGRPVTQLDPGKGTYVDEEGNVFQLLDKGETKPIEVEHLPGTGENRTRTTTGGFLERREDARAKRRFEKNAAKKSNQRT